MTDDLVDAQEQTNLERLPLLRQYEERRKYPRVDLQVPVTVTTREGTVVDARLRNVCAQGVQLRCEPNSAQTLHPRGTRIPSAGGAFIAFRFDLPIGGETRSFTASGRLCYIAACRPGGRPRRWIRQRPDAG